MHRYDQAFFCGAESIVSDHLCVSDSTLESAIGTEVHWSWCHTNAEVAASWLVEFYKRFVRDFRRIIGKGDVNFPSTDSEEIRIFRGPPARTKFYRVVCTVYLSILFVYVYICSW